MFFICRHKWEVLKSFDTESRSEQAKRLGQHHSSFTVVQHDMLKKKNVTILSCNKCGKVKKIVTTY